MTPSDAPVGRLIVCPTPIGNLMDVTLRVLEALERADLIACEDTRHTRILLGRHGIRASLVSLHEHNEATRSQELRGRIAGGATIALVSDAGMPLLADPGFELVRACLESGLAVEVLPGPSAALTAVVASGLGAGRWCFVGFLPRRQGEARALLAGTRETIVAFESPRRLAGSLALLAEIDPARRVAVCRELTKLHEEVLRGSAAELSAHYRESPARGEIVVVIGAAAAETAEREPAVEALRELVESGARARTAAGVLARLTGIGANELYRELTRTGK